MLLSNFIPEMKAMRGRYEKIAHLKRYDSPFFRELMDALFNPFRRFNVGISRRQMKYFGEKDLSEMEAEVRQLLLELEVSYSSKQNQQKVLDVMKHIDKGSQTFLQAVVNKKAKIGVGQRIILQVFEGLFVPFNPQKGHLYNPDKTYTVPEWYATPKFNGLRAVCLYKNNFWTLRTYVGHEISTCDHLIPGLEALREKFGYTMVDGELYRHDLEFSQIQSAVLTSTNTDSGAIAEIGLHVFTAGQEHFFSDEVCEGFVPKLPVFESSGVITYPAVVVTTPEEIKDFYIWCIEQGYEGAVLRNPQKPYDFKKSNAFLKVKKDCFGDLSISDCMVNEIIAGEIPIANEVGGYDTIPAMAALRVVQPNGLECKVGTGFSQEFRIRVLAGDIEVLGKIIEVKHEGWGAQGRMIFPRFRLLRHPHDKAEAT